MIYQSTAPEIGNRAFQNRIDKFRSEQVERAPLSVQRELVRAIRRVQKRQGYADANRFVRRWVDGLDRNLPLNADAELIREWADAHARIASLEMSRHESEADQLQAGEIVAMANGIEPPGKDVKTVAGAIARLRCPDWWKRRAKKTIFRRIERSLIDLEVIHRREQCYVSNEAVSRSRSQRANNTQMLQAMEAINQHGDVYTLAELAELSTANPELRRNELMTRIRGMEEHAKAHDRKAVFITWTTPSAFHAIKSRTCRRNPNYEGQTPREAHQYMTGLWAKVRAKLARQGVSYSGLRVAEPHHDGTPHWHLLIFASRKDLHRVIATIQAYALQDAPDEQGARQHRVKAEWINQRTGSATGYIAKYIAKAIDGHAVGDALALGDDGKQWAIDADAATNAERVRAWASVWGIRQFQFFGTPPVTWWRELRRADQTIDPGCELIAAARRAADAGDFEKFMSVCDHAALETWREQTGEINQYGEPADPVVMGVESPDAQFHTRRYVWTIRPRSGPWSSVNNCTRR